MITQPVGVWQDLNLVKRSLEVHLFTIKSFVQVWNSETDISIFLMQPHQQPGQVGLIGSVD